MQVWLLGMAVNGGAHPERCILVTGGAGYIGTHTSLQLLLDGYKVVIIDNFLNSCEEAVRRVVDLAGKRGKNLVVHKVGKLWNFISLLASPFILQLLAFFFEVMLHLRLELIFINLLEMGPFC